MIRQFSVGLSRAHLTSMLLVWCACVLAPCVARADLPGEIDLEPPGQREFILDKAGLINAADQQQIKQIANKLLTDKAAPIIVVTIESMAKHGSPNMRIETFARLLFDQWGIGHEQINGKSWNYGILLLVSRDDRKARIELGAGWKRDKDDVALRIMDQQIVPHFKSGAYSAGILAGVGGLDRMARDLPSPMGSGSQMSNRPSRPGDYLIPAIILGLGLFTVISLIRQGSNGWAWLFWGVLFSIIGSMLYHMATSRSGHSSGGGFGGGSFGGGFSGGGGASGSW